MAAWQTRLAVPLVAPAVGLALLAAVSAWAVEVDGRVERAVAVAAKAGATVGPAVPVLIVGPDAAAVVRRLAASGVAARYGAGSGRAHIDAAALALLRGRERARVVPPARLYPMLDLAAPAIALDAAVRAERGGRDVLIAILDTGIDFTHPDFLHTDGSTRIVAYWDQTAAADGSAPYGLICDANDIDLGRCPNRADEPFDTFLPLGHGTHVAGIAAGGDARFRGIAPEALLVGVRLNFDELGLIDALEWVHDLAATLGKPAVVNLSLGANEGPHDGSAPSEVAIDALSGPGFVVVAAAGNEAPTVTGGPIHVRFTPGGDRARFAAAGLGTVQRFALEVWSDSNTMFRAGLALEFGASSGNLGTVRDQTPLWSPDAVAAGGESVTLTSGASDIVRVEAFALATTRAHGLALQINRVTSNLGGFDFHLAVTGHDAPVDAWLTDRVAFFDEISGPQVLNFADGSTAGVTWVAGDGLRLVTLPGNGVQALTVGGFVTRNEWDAIDGNRYTSSAALGTLLDVSGVGPTRDGRIKPDIAAPGEMIASSRASTNQLAPDFLALDDTHTLQRGTSMAAPHVAGVAALLLQGQPAATAAQVRTWLAAAAITDVATGDVPNTRWGAGKLHLAAAVTAPLWLDVASPDVTPPAITGATVQRRGDGRWLTWWTDELATSQIDYGDGRRGGRQSFSRFHEVPLQASGGNVVLLSSDPRGNLAAPVVVPVDGGGGCGVAGPAGGAPLLPLLLALVVIYGRLGHPILPWRQDKRASRSRKRAT